MFITARQLEDLHKANGSNGHVVLPYRARLSPLARDWVRARKVELGYSDSETGGATPAVPTFRGHSRSGVSDPDAVTNKISPVTKQDSESTGSVLWWCDGPCGPAKAALMGLAKETSLTAIEQPADPRQLVPVIKTIAAEIRSGRASAGVLLVQNAALAVVYANRCPSLRAVVGTCLEAVEQGIQQAAANVLVIEHPHKTLQQVKNLLSRFARARRELSDDVRRQLQELASCG